MLQGTAQGSMLSTTLSEVFINDTMVATEAAKARSQGGERSAIEIDVRGGFRGNTRKHQGNCRNI